MITAERTAINGLVQEIERWREERWWLDQAYVENNSEPKEFAGDFGLSRQG